MKPIENRLHANIRYQSTLYSVKQNELEAALGINHTTFWRRLKNQTFTVVDLKRMAKALYTTPEELLKGVK